MTNTEPRDTAAALETHADTLQAESDRRIVHEGDLNDQIAMQTRKNVQAEDLFRLLVESVRDYAIFMLDPTGRVATWNAGAQRFKGYTAAEIIGRHFSTFYPEEDVQAGKCEFELDGARREGRFEDEGWRVRKDGSRFWANVVITAVRDRANRLVGFAKVTRDLTEQRRAEEQRLAAEHRFRLLVESVKDYALFILDPGGNILTWNAGAERIKGYTATEIIGSHFSRFYPPDRVETGICERELEIAERDGRFEDEGWRIRKDGSQFWANVVISPVRDKQGALVGFSKVTRDLTERKRGEDEHAARLAAEQASKAKDEFLAMLGHELRNPLAPIATALQLLKLRADPRSAREHQVIERQVAHMSRLVDDLLDVSGITRGKIELKRKHLDVRDVIAKAIEIAGPLLEQRCHHFEVATPKSPVVVDGDEARLTQVFTNLLTNAAKYTDPGGHINVMVRPTGDHVVVEVRDDGIGLSRELLARVFDLYVQAPQSPERNVGGLGLGLTLVRSLVKLHDGEVEANSDGPGRGSSFVVRLPMVFQPVAESVEPLGAAFPSTLRRQRILIVDDNEDARMLLSDILVALGHEVQSAGDGPDALQLIKRFQPSVAILDIGLPVMDGYELATTLRATMKASTPPLIALSGYGQPADRERSQSAGFDRHLVKPVDVRRLLETIRELNG
jgi:PAS domain S-box-containing protein